MRDLSARTLLMLKGFDINIAVRARQSILTCAGGWAARASIAMITAAVTRSIG
jgi:hypothetical protein